MSVHKDGRSFKVRWRQDGSNRSRSFDRHGDAKTFEGEEGKFEKYFSPKPGSGD